MATENIQLEFEHHKMRMNHARECFNNKLRTMIETMHAEFDNYVLFENQNHLNRMLSRATNQSVNPLHDICYETYCATIL